MFKIFHWIAWLSHSNWWSTNGNYLQIAVGRRQHLFASESRSVRPWKTAANCRLEDHCSLHISSTARGRAKVLPWNTNQLALSWELNIKADITFLKRKFSAIRSKDPFFFFNRIDIINFWLREHYKWLLWVCPGKKKALIFYFLFFIFTLVMQSTAKMFLHVVHQNSPYLPGREVRQAESQCMSSPMISLSRAYSVCRNRQVLSHSKVRTGTEKSA